MLSFYNGKVYKILQISIFMNLKSELVQKTRDPKIINLIIELKNLELNSETVKEIGDVVNDFLNDRNYFYGIIGKGDYINPTNEDRIRLFYYAYFASNRIQ